MASHGNINMETGKGGSQRQRRRGQGSRQRRVGGNAALRNEPRIGGESGMRHQIVYAFPSVPGDGNAGAQLTDSESQCQCGLHVSI